MKAPLPVFIADLYFKRFGRERPEVVMSIEQRVRAQAQRKAERKATTARVATDPGWQDSSQ